MKPEVPFARDTRNVQYRQHLGEVGRLVVRQKECEDGINIKLVYSKRIKKRVVTAKTRRSPEPLY